MLLYISFVFLDLSKLNTYNIQCSANAVCFEFELCVCTMYMVHGTRHIKYIMHIIAVCILYFVLQLKETSKPVVIAEICYKT